MMMKSLEWKNENKQNYLDLWWTNPDNISSYYKLIIEHGDW